MSKPPTMATWQQLYGAAVAFRDLACWEWLSDADLVAVQDPATREMGYCCVMGAAGEFFALAVYLGADGLASYVRVRDSTSDHEDAVLDQKCLMASFGERAALEKEDLDTIKGLGLKFRGRNAWPLFRSHLPGYYPWHLTEREAKFLTLALEQSYEVASRARDEPGLLDSKGPTSMLARVPEVSGGGRRWRDEWIAPVVPSRPAGVAAAPDELSLRRVKGSLSRRPMTWEIDVFYLPAVISEGERPYIPSVLLCVDRGSGFIFGTEVMGPKERIQPSGKLMAYFSRAGAFPSEIAVTKKNVFEMLEPTALALGIELRLVKRVRMLERARRALSKEFGGRVAF